MGLSPRQAEALAHMSRSGRGMAAKRLAKLMGLPVVTVHSLVKPLRESGLIVTRYPMTGSGSPRWQITTDGANECVSQFQTPRGH